MSKQKEIYKKWLDIHCFYIDLKQHLSDSELLPSHFSVLAGDFSYVTQISRSYSIWISNDKVSHFLMKYKSTEYSVFLCIKKSSKRNILNQGSALFHWKQCFFVSIYNIKCLLSFLKYFSASIYFFFWYRFLGSALIMWRSPHRPFVGLQIGTLQTAHLKVVVSPFFWGFSNPCWQ